MDRTRLVRTAIKSTLAVVLLLVIVQLAYWLGVRRYFVSLADAVAPAAQLSFDRVVAFPPGQIGLDGVRFAAAGGEDTVLQAERLRARTHDVEWLARWLLGLDRGAPDQLAIRLDGVRASAALIRQLRRRADAVGLVIPFEGVGCGDAFTMADLDYEALGWSDWRIDVQIDLVHDRAARRLELAVRVDRTPAGMLRARLHLADVPDRGLVLASGLGGARLERVELEFDEQGELARRNHHCSADQSSDDAFISTHLERVHDWLSGHGIVPDEPVWAAYREWVAIGGPIHLVAEPTQGVLLHEYPQFAPEDRLRLLGVSARVNSGEPVPVEATAARIGDRDFRPLPPLGDIDPHQAFDPPDEPVSGVVDGNVNLESPSGEVASDGVMESLDDDAVEPAPENDSGRRPADATGLPATVVVVAATYRAIDFPELAMHLGDRVRIDTVSGNQHRGVVLDATADAVELEIRRYGGGARLPIARDQISRIDVVVDGR